MLATWWKNGEDVLLGRFGAAAQWPPRPLSPLCLPINTEGESITKEERNRTRGLGKKRDKTGERTTQKRREGEREREREGRRENRKQKREEGKKEKKRKEKEKQSILQRREEEGPPLEPP